MDDSDPLSGNGNGVSDDVGHASGGLVSFVGSNYQPLLGPSSESPYVGRYLGMLDGQTLPETPFVALSEDGEDSDGPDISNSLQASFETGHHESSSGEHVPSSSHADNDMDLDDAPCGWKQNFTT